MSGIARTAKKIVGAGIDVGKEFVAGGVELVAGEAMKNLMPKMPDMGGGKELPVRGGPADPEIEKRVTQDFATREQAVKRAAVAAGATRSENDADLLGYTTPKRRAASRTLLGGR